MLSDENFRYKERDGWIDAKDPFEKLFKDYSTMNFIFSQIPSYKSLGDAHTHNKYNIKGKGSDEEGELLFSFK